MNHGNDTSFMELHHGDGNELHIGGQLASLM